MGNSSHQPTPDHLWKKTKGAVGVNPSEKGEDERFLGNPFLDPRSGHMRRRSQKELTFSHLGVRIGKKNSPGENGKK